MSILVTPANSKATAQAKDKRDAFPSQPADMELGHLHGGYMREILSIALVLAVAGFFVITVMAVSLALSKTVTPTETVTNNQIYRGMTGLKVSLPHDMKNFPVELVPLP